MRKTCISALIGIMLLLPAACGDDVERVDRRGPLIDAQTPVAPHDGTYSVQLVNARAASDKLPACQLSLEGRRLQAVTVVSPPHITLDGRYDGTYGSVRFGAVQDATGVYLVGEWFVFVSSTQTSRTHLRLADDGRGSALGVATLTNYRADGITPICAEVADVTGTFAPNVSTVQPTESWSGR